MQTVALDPFEERTCEAFDLLMRIANISNQHFGERVELSHASVQAKRKRGARIRAGQAERFADALGVPSDVLRMTRAEVFAWLAEHPEWAARDSNPEPTGRGFSVDRPRTRPPAPNDTLTPSSHSPYRRHARVHPGGVRTLGAAA